MTEKWKYIKGYEEMYEVSSRGKVRSYVNGKWSGKRKTPKILNGTMDKSGYRYANLFKKGRKTLRPVHKLVAEAFILNPNNKPHVNHIDGNKLNNNFTNLEWVTKSEDLIHAYKNGLRKHKSRI